MRKNNLANERIGIVRINNHGSLMKVVEYKNSQNVTVEFLKDEYFTNAQWADFIIGNVKNPYDKTTFGIGYIGEGEYLATKNNKGTHQYDTWKSMMGRCYNEKFQEKHPAYIGCTVTEEWHCFQNFAKWYDENYYIVNSEKMSLDKDILLKGNKIYSPETCIFAPSRINSLFAKRHASRGEYPIGVSLKKDKYTACCNGINFGVFNTPEDAFIAYKISKEKLIKQIAYEYKWLIPSKLYFAMLNYSIEITD